MSSRWKECKDQESLEISKRKSMQSEEGALVWDRQHCLGQW